MKKTPPWSKWLALALGVLAVVGVVAWWFLGRTHDGISVAVAAKLAPATDAAALSTKAIADTDLPPAGTRSLFDHLMAQGDGVPYPFPKLLAAMQALHPEGAAPLTLLVPDGRSLLKAQADYAHPRIVAALDFEGPATPASLGLAPKGQVFFAFTELANEIEVISYNEAAGRYEFQLVQGYSDDGPRKLVYASRSICQSCHQGGVPIFSQRPWNETNGQPETAARIAAATKDAGGDGAHYLGLPVAEPLASPERFDQLTDVGAFVVATQRLWLDGCGAGAEGSACRRQLLRLALRHARAPGDFDAAGPEVAKLVALQQAAAAKTVIGEPQSDLANRDPLGEKKGFKGWFRQLVQKPVRLGEGAKTNEDLDAFDSLPKLPGVQDPLTRRAPRRGFTAQSIDGVYGVSSLFAASDIALLAAAGQDWAQVEAAVARLPEEFFAPRPFARVPTVQALHGLVSKLAAGPPGYCCLDVSEMSPPIASGEPPVVLAAGSALQPFADHCFGCHRGNPAKRLNFMTGATEAEVAAHVKEKAQIRDVLDWERYANTDKASMLMPPADSVERREMDAALKRDPQLLEKMRAVVPGLFEF